jgi:hypothetical protein
MIAGAVLLQRILLIMWQLTFRFISVKSHYMYERPAKITYHLAEIDKRERVIVNYVSKFMPLQEVARFTCFVPPVLAHERLRQYDKIKVRGHSRS